MQIRRRQADWAEALQSVLDTHRAAYFQWGRYDCGTLMADAVACQIGRDPFAHLRGYDSAGSAMMAMRRFGVKSMRQAVDRHFERIDPAHAQRGDLVLPSESALPLNCPAVVVGAFAVSRDQSGWVVMPMTAATVTVAWQVG
jgi:hypothetical protein